LRKMLFLLGSVLPLASVAMAATPQSYLYFGKANTRYGDFLQDERACTASARSDFTIHYYDTPQNHGGETCTQYNATAFLACMRDRGYQRDTKDLQEAKWFQTTWRWRMQDSNRDCDRDREKTRLWLAKPFQSR